MRRGTSLPLEIELPDGTILEAPDGSDPSTVAKAYLARQGSRRPFVGPIPTGQELADSRPKPPKQLGALETARLTMTPAQRAGLGIGEAALSVGTGMVSAPLNFLWNAGLEAFELPTAEPVGTYTPRSPEGQSILSGIDKAMRFTRIPQAIEAGMDLENPDPAVRATGNLIGAGLGIVPGYGSARAMLRRRVPAPTRAEIKTAANQAYQRAEEAGGILPQQNLGGFVQQAEQMLVKEGFDQQLNPKTYAAVQRFMDEATKPGIAGHSAQGAEILRRVLLNAEKSADIGSADARLAGKLVDEFDDFMDTQLPAASGEYANARALWNTQRKAQDIETLFERAQNQAGQYSVSGMQNALRTQFKQLADNPRRFGRFSEAERAAILKVVRGGPIQNFLQAWGKFDPFKGGLPSIGTYIAGAVSPDFGIGLAATGVAARHGAAGLRSGAARRVDELVRSGAIPAMPSRIPGSQPLPRLGYLPGVSLGVEEAAEPVPPEPFLEYLMRRGNPPR